jgi:hypothetical protein
MMDLAHKGFVVRRKESAALKFDHKRARMGAVVGFFDESEVKLSVDTEADLDAVRHNFERVKEKSRSAEKEYGRENVHRF